MYKVLKKTFSNVNSQAIKSFSEFLTNVDENNVPLLLYTILSDNQALWDKASELWLQKPEDPMNLGLNAIFMRDTPGDVRRENGCLNAWIRATIKNDKFSEFQLLLTVVGNYAYVHKLLQAIAKFNRKEFAQLIIDHYRVRRGLENYGNVLLWHRHGHDQTNSTILPALEICISKDYVDTFKVFYSVMHPSIMYFGESILSKVIDKHAANILDYLLTQKLATVEDPVLYYSSAIEKAVAGKNEDCIKILLHHGAKVSKTLAEHCEQKSFSDDLKRTLHEAYEEQNNTRDVNTSSRRIA